MGKTNRSNKKDKAVNSRTSINFVLICPIHWDMFFLKFTGSSNSTKNSLDFMLVDIPVCLHIQPFSCSLKPLLIVWFDFA